jgi:hypothetical protein
VSRKGFAIYWQSRSFPGRLMRLHQLLLSVTLLAASGSVSYGRIVSIQAFDRGSYDNFGLHSPTDTNYVVGAPVGTRIYRNFFAFDLSGVVLAPRERVTSASLVLNTFHVSAPSGIETVAFFDVTTPLASLLAGGSSQTAIYDDLGTGVIYALQTYRNVDLFTTKNILLNVDAISAIQNSVGSRFAIGGADISLDSDSRFPEHVFASSNAEPSIQRLDLIIQIPEPPAFVLAATCLSPLSLIQRRGQR